MIQDTMLNSKVIIKKNLSKTHDAKQLNKINYIKYMCKTCILEKGKWYEWPKMRQSSRITVSLLQTFDLVGQHTMCGQEFAQI